MVSISPGTLSFIIEKAREFDAESAPVDPDSGSSPVDDAVIDILEDTSDNPTREELAGALNSLNRDQRAELLAMMMIGRGDYAASEWRQALTQARYVLDARLTRYLIETPLLGDYLANAANDLGIDIAEYPGVRGELQP
ncbi:MAG TPA: DUF3775 domain-containing protein [Stellaceae bacterium]|nr:DUF3775 domain-containing protein [Stellaceae bacterium]